MKTEGQPQDPLHSTALLHLEHQFFSRYLPPGHWNTMTAELLSYIEIPCVPRKEMDLRRGLEDSIELACWDIRGRPPFKNHPPHPLLSSSLSSSSSIHVAQVIPIAHRQHLPLAPCPPQKAVAKSPTATAFSPSHPLLAVAAVVSLRLASSRLKPLVSRSRRLHQPPLARPIVGVKCLEALFFQVSLLSHSIVAFSEFNLANTFLEAASALPPPINKQRTDFFRRFCDTMPLHVIENLRMDLSVLDFIKMAQVIGFNTTLGKVMDAAVKLKVRRGYVVLGTPEGGLGGHGENTVDVASGHTDSLGSHREADSPLSEYADNIDRIFQSNSEMQGDDSIIQEILERWLDLGSPQLGYPISQAGDEPDPFVSAPTVSQDDGGALPLIHTPLNGGQPGPRQANASPFCPIAIPIPQYPQVLQDSGSSTYSYDQSPLAGKGRQVNRLGAMHLMANAYMASQGNRGGLTLRHASSNGPLAASKSFSSAPNGLPNTSNGHFSAPNGASAPQNVLSTHSNGLTAASNVRPANLAAIPAAPNGLPVAPNSFAAPSSLPVENRPPEAQGRVSGAIASYPFAQEVFPSKMQFMPPTASAPGVTPIKLGTVRHRVDTPMSDFPKRTRVAESTPSTVSSTWYAVIRGKVAGVAEGEVKAIQLVAGYVGAIVFARPTRHLAEDCFMAEWLAQRVHSESGEFYDIRLPL
ncbi:hypothetical protein NMY22_g450 [Coprinellus aureogranulatus]|nr:hypothetical protein NMY22_g450 [Coprinellus aureogranulatus]